MNLTNAIISIMTKNSGYVFEQILTLFFQLNHFYIS